MGIHHRPSLSNRGKITEVSPSVEDAQVFAVLYQLTHDLARAANIPAIAHSLFTSSRRLVDARYGFLLLANSNAAELHGVAAYGPHTEDFTNATIQFHEDSGLTTLLSQHQRPAVITDTTSLPQVSTLLRQNYPYVKSPWIIPLMNGTQALGLFILGYAYARLPTTKEDQVLRLLSDEATFAIERKRHEEALRQSEARHRVMFEKNRAVKLLIDPASSAILDANPAAAHFYGYSKDQLRHMRITDLNILPVEQVAAAMRQAVTEQASAFRFQHRLASGEVREVEVYSSPLQLHDRPVLYSIVHDVTKRIRAEEELHRLNVDLEQRVSTRTADLQWALAELQQLMRIATHDLQEPVRTIAAYLQVLTQNYHDKLDGDAHDLMTTVIEATKRLQRLMLDLLAYAEVSTQQVEFASIDCETLLTTVLADLRDAIADQGAVITHDPLPQIWGDANLLQLVFRNIIHNGIKFHDRALPSIHVSATSQDQVWMFTISDNGVGIAPDLGEKIFLPFQRLHTREPYPKPGIGLALCKKIIERHKGRIWADSTAAQGAAVHFTLPRRTIPH